MKTRCIFGETKKVMKILLDILAWVAAMIVCSLLIGWFILDSLRLFLPEASFGDAFGIGLDICLVFLWVRIFHNITK